MFYLPFCDIDPSREVEGDGVLPYNWELEVQFLHLASINTQESVWVGMEV